MYTQVPVETTTRPHLSTLTVPPHQRLEFWREMVRDPVVPLEFDMPDQKTLDASLSWWEIGDLRLSHIQASAHRVKRLPARVGMDSLVLDFILEGQCYAEQDGRRVGLGPGSGVICNAARPYSLVFPEPCKLAVLTFPRELLSRHVAAIDRGTATDLAHNSHIFPLLAAYVRQLISQAPSLTPSISKVVAQHLSDLVCSSVGENLSQSPLPLSEHKAATLIRVHAYVAAHLHEPNLNPEVVANALRVSSRYINQLLGAEETSLGRLILRKRLDAVASALRDSSLASRSISTLALSLGFNDLTHFSKSFRQHHGLSAREYRQESELQEPSSTWPELKPSS